MENHDTCYTRSKLFYKKKKSSTHIIRFNILADKEAEAKNVNKTKYALDQEKRKLHDTDAVICCPL